MTNVIRRFEWTSDCSGKQDFDGEIVGFNSRYRPRGGSATLIYRDGTIETAADRPHIKPSAVSTVQVLGITIATKKFEADTEEEVKTEVENWVREQISGILTRMGLSHLEG